jgi:hypothetical protein
MSKPRLDGLIRSRHFSVSQEACDVNVVNVPSRISLPVVSSTVVLV